MKTIEINKIDKSNKEVCIDFTTSEDLSIYFNEKQFRYSSEQDLSIVPDSILIIPLVINILPLIWLTDSTLIIKELDKSFYESIENFKKGYQAMHPLLDFKGNVLVENITDNIYEGSNSIVLFSGGIDAICTTLRHHNEKPLLLTLWGSADYPTDDINGWEQHYKNIMYNGKSLGLTNTYIKTNFCEFMPIWGEELNALGQGAKWWHDLQHGIGIIGHAAPIAFLNKVKTVYIASSYTETQKPYVCASDPTIDSFVRFGSTQVIHDAYELSRQDKISLICNKLKQNNIELNIQVCLRQYQDGNCCHCEKCYRTMLGLLLEGVNPNNYGFSYNDSDLKRIIYELNNKIEISKFSIPAYKDIQQKIKNGVYSDIPKELREWFLHSDFDKINTTLQKRIRRIIVQTRKFLKI